MPFEGVYTGHRLPRAKRSGPLLADFANQMPEFLAQTARTTPTKGLDPPKKAHFDVRNTPPPWVTSKGDRQGWLGGWWLGGWLAGWLAGWLGSGWAAGWLGKIIGFDWAAAILNSEQNVSIP